MKEFKNSFKIIRLAALAIGIVFFNSCDLELQEDYDFDDSATVFPEFPPFEVSLYQFMTEQADFVLMVEAIDRAGLQNAFNEGADDKTVLMLRQEAMEEFLEDQGVTTVAEVPVETLRNLLNYHIITTRFTQNDLNSQEDVQFQTRIEGPNGRINVWKWRRFMEIRINQNGSPDLPGTAKGANVFLHNYQFTNGVGHQMNGYVQWAPF
nr:fasciclin domain-containing protein [Allomuricauda sp.]